MDRIVWRKVETKENAEREHTAKSSRKGDISNPQPATPRGASWHVGTRVSRKDLAPDLSGFHGQIHTWPNRIGDRTVNESRTSPSPRTRPGRCRVSRRKAAQPDAILGFRGRPSLWANRGLGRLQSAPQVPKALTRGVRRIGSGALRRLIVPGGKPLGSLTILTNRGPTCP